jgi:NAD(P)-dependent dehydrogenase (short-subunit alcohol dehydrogenase family)
VGQLDGKVAAAYQVSKHRIIGLCYATMLEEREHGIRVSAILPGLVDTPPVLRRPQPPSPPAPTSRS